MISIPEHELQWSFVRSGGPGGQNVNKVATKAVLRWNILQSVIISDTVKARLQPRTTKTGDLIVTSQRYRDQDRNRQDCLEKLVAIVRQASVRPKARRKSRPTRASKESRMQEKRRRSGVKKLRRKPDED